MVKKRYIYFAIIVVAIFLIVLGSFFDLQINQAIFLEKNVFSILLASIGEAPSYAMFAFFGGLLIFGSLNCLKNKPLKALLHFIGTLTIVAMIYVDGSVFTSNNGWGAFNENLRVFPLIILFGSILMLPAGIAGIFLGKLIKSPRTLIMIIVIMLCFLATLGTFNLIKIILRRPRYRFIASQNDLSLFRNWWEPFSDYQKYIDSGIIKDEFKSFPSGHTSTSCCTIMVAFIPVLFGYKSEKKQLILTLIGYSWCLLIGFSRMLCGAHFMSDVGFGMLNGVIFMLIANEIVLRIQEK